MSVLLILAGLAGFVAFETKGKKTTSSNSKIKLNPNCTKFISPKELIKIGFGYDNRTFGLSGLFLQQHSWNQTKEQYIISEFNKLPIKNFNSLFELSSQGFEYFYGTCELGEYQETDNSVSLRKYLQIDLFLTYSFTLFKNNIFNEVDLKGALKFIEDFSKTDKYIYSSEDIKLVITKNESIQTYYKNIFRFLPEYKKIPTKILAQNECFRSSIKYIKENQFQFYNYSDSEITRLNWIIGKAKQ